MIQAYSFGNADLAPVVHLAHRVDDSRGLEVSPRMIPDFELVYIEEGEGLFRIGEEESRYAAGCLILTPPWLRHSYRSLGGRVAHYALHFDIREGFSDRFQEYRHGRPQAGEAAIEFEARVRIPFVLPDFGRSCVPRLESLITQFSEVELRRFASLQLRMAAVILELLASIIARCAGEPTGPRRFARAAACLDSRFTEDFSVADLAAMEGYSPNYFAAEFGRCYGVSPLDYLRARRVALAKELLRETGHSVACIAALCGYQDPYHFSRVFKRHAQVSPRQYRELSSPD
jgi:AraC family transcriptional regulator, arabinose operon regulatory protein